MKLKGLVFLAAFLLVVSAAFSQDAGAPDSIKMVVISAPLQQGLPSQPFVVACSVFVDAGSLTTLQFGWKWDNPDLQMDSAFASAAFDAMEIGPFFYEDDSKATTNANKRAVCSGTSIFSNYPSAAGWRWLCTYNMTVSNWSAARSNITIDTADFNAASQYIFIPSGGGSPYQAIWKGPINVSSNGVNESNTDVLPKSFGLEQNYPNPFNPSTDIWFDLPSKSHVNLKVYNLLGQEVNSLVNEDLPAGRHRTQWNGTSSDGSHVASGIYFYKMVSGDFVDTKKMMLIK